MRDKISKVLEEWLIKNWNIEPGKINKRLFYGMKPSNVETEDWNYIVFGMEELDKSGTNSQDFNGYYYVDIIREDFIDDETIFGVIFAVEQISGMRLVRNSMPVDYVQKGKTNIVCEMIRLRFTRPIKRVNIDG